MLFTVRRLSSSCIESLLHGWFIFGDNYSLVRVFLCSDAEGDMMSEEL